MHKNLFWSLALFLSLLLSTTTCQELPDQIIEIFRHGARAVLGNYDPSWPSIQYGELTPVGMRQHYILGRVLAQKYPNLLGSDYNYSQVYVLSDKSPRCIQSAEAQLYGIYLGSGPSLGHNYPAGLAVPPYQDVLVQEVADSLSDSAALPHKFVPPVVQIVNASNGYTFQSDDEAYCPRDNLYITQNLKDNAHFKEGVKIFNTTINNINEYYNTSLSISDLSDLMDDIEVDLADNRTMPGGINNPELVKNLTYVYAWLSMQTYLGQEVQKQIASFGLIDAMIQQLTSFRQGEDYNTVALYSGHDGDIWAVLTALGVINGECLIDNFKSYLENGSTLYPACHYPGFASNVVIEFYNSTTTPKIKLYYNNLLITLCNGQEACTFDEFIFLARNATGNSTAQDYFRKCGTPMSSLVGSDPFESDLLYQVEDPIFSKIEIKAETVVILGLVIVCAVLFAKVLSDRKRYNRKYNELLSQVPESGFNRLI